MTMKDLAVMQAAIQKMRYSEKRQQVLSQNIANADTVGYKAHDVAAPDFQSLLGATASTRLNVTTTDAAHLGLGGRPVGRLADPKVQRDTYEVSPSGNSVVLEEQLMKMNQNFLDHRMTTTIYQKNIDMLKKSIQSQ